jgi:prolyl 4-hydroxylase
MSALKLKRSTIVDENTGESAEIAHRNSDGTYFFRSENSLVDRIEHRVAGLLGVPTDTCEGIQILRYGIGAEYRPHYDCFLPEHPGSAKHLEKGGQRVATVVVYLNEVERGGATTFPEIDFAVVPKKGSAAYFSYCDRQGRLDRLSLHAGTPVERGEKWIATLWYRQRAYV